MSDSVLIALLVVFIISEIKGKHRKCCSINTTFKSRTPELYNIP